jgi:hypothetical protein
MSSAKMKAKKLILFYFILFILNLDAKTILHTMISTTEERVMGHVFKHVMTSSIADQDQFYIDGKTVNHDLYRQELERMEKQEREQAYQQHIVTRRHRIEYTEMMQVQIAEKLLRRISEDVIELLDRIQNPSLEPFFVFTDTTIHSHEQLMQLKKFVMQIDHLIDDKVEQADFSGLYDLSTKLEPWPARLEKFFEDTMQQAIKKSDDTAMLKELLKLVGQTS